MWWRPNHASPSNHTIHHCGIINNRNYNTGRGRWVFWESWPHTMKHLVFPDCASEVLKGSKKHEDIPHGSLATISCTGGCIHFTKVYIIRANMSFPVTCKLNQPGTPKLPLKYFLLVGWYYKFAKYRLQIEMFILRPCLDVTILKQQWILVDHSNKSMRSNWSSWKESAKAKNLALPRLVTAGGIQTSIVPLMSQPSCGCIIIAMVFQGEGSWIQSQMEEAVRLGPLHQPVLLLLQ